MFSIVIPVYNYDCTRLVEELVQSCSIARIDYEILLGNDASTDKEVLAALSNIATMPHCRVITEEHNIGRAFVLNHLAKLATYPYLLIIDSDARLRDDDFIETYVKYAGGQDVVCGGIATSKIYRRPDNRLRYYYEKSATGHRSVEWRRLHPYERLSTFNLLIRRSVFEHFHFDKHCFQYGYEDTILGLDLMREGYRILHIDNPLIHTGIDSNRSFMRKTRQAMHVLLGLEPYYKERIRLSRTAMTLERKHLLGLVSRWHRLFGHIEEKLLMRWPTLWMFNLYKLGYYSLLMRGEDPDPNLRPKEQSVAS